MEHANGSFVISECNNCKGRWSCVSGLFNQSYLLGVINTLITVATRIRTNLCTRKVIIKPSKCHPLELLTGVFNREKIFSERKNSFRAYIFFELFFTQANRFKVCFCFFVFFLKSELDFTLQTFWQLIYFLFNRTSI